MKRIVTHWTPNLLASPQQAKHWVQHYRQSGFQISIQMDPAHKALFEQQVDVEGDLRSIVDDYDENHNHNSIHLEWATDYLFEWFVDDQDQFVLLKPLVTNWSNNGVIGRVFQVPIVNKDPVTTFEIPDFVQYKHERHSAFTQHGIFAAGYDNGAKNPSDRWVCFSLVPSTKSCSLQYYQNDVLLYSERKHVIGKRVYDFYHMNVVVQKEKRYGIIWHPKAGCTTLMKMFCSVNRITLYSGQSIRSLNYFSEKYRYNVYLEEMDYIHFVRNPYKRFLSTFLDKHVYQRDGVFIQLRGYMEWKQQFPKGNLMDVCEFIKQGKYISEHYTPQSKIILSPDIPTFQMDDERGLNHYFTAFLKKYHPRMDMLELLGCYENSIQTYSLERKTERNVLSWLKHFSKEEWCDYLNKHNLNYTAILDDELKWAIYSLYKEDFERFGYDPELPDTPPFVKKIHYNQVQRSSIGIVDDFNPEWMQI